MVGKFADGMQKGQFLLAYVGSKILKDHSVEITRMELEKRETGLPTWRETAMEAGRECRKVEEDQTQNLGEYLLLRERWRQKTPAKETEWPLIALQIKPLHILNKRQISMVKDEENTWVLFLIL